MNRFLKSLLVILSAASLHSQAAVSQFGTAFTINPKRVDFEVPNRSFGRLPRQLGVYVAEKGEGFRREAIDWIIEQSALSDRDKADVKKRIQESPSILTAGKTTLLRAGHTNVFLNTDDGTFAVQIPAPDDLLQILPSANERAKNLDFDHFRNALAALLGQLGWKDDEIQRKPDGTYKMQASDLNKYPNHQKEPVLAERSVTFYRQVDDYPIVSTDPFQIKLTRLGTGQWREIFIYWPHFRRTATVARKFDSNADLMKALESRFILWDNGNNISPDEVEHIRITNVRLAYFHSRNSSLAPALILDATVKAMNGRGDDAVLFLPLR